MSQRNRSDDDAITISAAAKLLDVIPRTVERWIERGSLRGILMDGQQLVDASSAAECLARRSQLQAARDAFVHGSEIDQVAYITGISTSDLRKLATFDE